MVGNLLERVLGHQRFGSLGSILHIHRLHQAAQIPVHCQVGIAANRRSEMRVIRFAQAEVPVGTCAVDGALETTQKLCFQNVALRVLGNFGKNLYYFPAVCQIAAINAEKLKLFAQIKKFVFVGLVVDARNERNVVGEKLARNGLVGGKHKLLHKLVAFVGGEFLNARGVALGVAEDFYFGHFQVKRALAHALFAQR